MTERQKLPDLEPGQVIDGLFRIERKLGAGGMGGVYLARHATLGRTFALKTIAAIPGGVEMKTARDRFEREARLAANLRHPSILSVLHYGTDPATGLAYYTMEDHLLSSDDVSRICRERLRIPPPPDRAAGPDKPFTLADALAGDRALGEEATIGVCREILSAIDAAHSFHPPIVHRDLKPSNLIFNREGHLLLSDFGIARPLADTARPDTPAAPNSDKSFAPLTLPYGPLPGTRNYAAPELSTGVTPTAAADFFSLGLVAYRLLTGGLPPEGRRTLPDDTAASVSPLWGKLFDRLLEPDPSMRLSDAMAVASTLDAIENSIARRHSRGKRLLLFSAAAMLALAAAATGVWIATLSRERQDVPQRHVVATRSAISPPRREGAWQGDFGGPLFLLGTLRSEVIEKKIDDLFSTAPKDVRAAFAEGSRQWMANQVEQAHASLTRAIDAQRKAAESIKASDPKGLRGAHARMAVILCRLSWTDIKLGLTKEFIETVDESVGLLREVVNYAPSGLEPLLSELLSEQAFARFSEGRYEVIPPILREALALWRASTDPSDVENRQREAVLVASLGESLRITEQEEEALAITDEAIGIIESLSEAIQDDPILCDLLAGCYYRKGEILRKDKTRMESLDAFGKSLTLYRIRFEQKPGAYQATYLQVMSRVVYRLASMGFDQEAIKISEEALPLLRDLSTRYPRVRDQLILFIRNLGALYGRTGDIAQAMRYRAEADELEKAADSQ